MKENNQKNKREEKGIGICRHCAVVGVSLQAIHGSIRYGADSSHIEKIDTIIENLAFGTLYTPYSLISFFWSAGIPRHPRHYNIPTQEIVNTNQVMEE